MIGIAILGYGVVGAGVGKLLTEQAGRLSRAVGEEIRLKYVVDIRDVPLPAGVTLAKELDTALADADVRVVVETIGGKGIAYQYTRRALEAGRHVVSSNKELVATHALAAKAYLYVASAKEHGVKLYRDMHRDATVMYDSAAYFAGEVIENQSVYGFER